MWKGTTLLQKQLQLTWKHLFREYSVGIREIDKLMGRQTMSVESKKVEQ